MLDKHLYFEASVFFYMFLCICIYKNLYFKETDGGDSRPIWSNESPLRNLFRIPQTKAELSKDYYWQFAFEIWQLDVKGKFELVSTRGGVFMLMEHNVFCFCLAENIFFAQFRDQQSKSILNFFSQIARS